MEKRIFKSSNDFKDLPKESEALEAVFQDIKKQEVETSLPEKQLIDSASSDPRLQDPKKQVVETSPAEIQIDNVKSSKQVQFNLESDSEDDMDFNNLNNFQNNNSDDQVLDDEELEDQELDDPELEDLTSKLSKIYYKFMTKYEHLDNVKNKVLIKEIIKMAIDNLPESDNIDYYLNFIESSIKHFNN